MKITILIVLLSIASFCFSSRNLSIQGKFYYELDISSHHPITASYLSERITDSTISQKSLVVRSEYLEGIVVRNGKSFFRYEKRVSASEYSSTFGVFNYGLVYSVNDFQFSVSSIPIHQQSPFNISPVLVVFYPFYTVGVNVDIVQYNLLTTTQGGEFLVSTDSSLSLDGLSFSNPLYGIQNLTLFPEFTFANELLPGNIVAQVEIGSTEDSPYYTFPCYLSTSNIGGESVDIYDCFFESLSFSGGISGWSFSLDENGYQKDKNVRPDQMAFSLF